MEGDGEGNSVDSSSLVSPDTTSLIEQWVPWKSRVSVSPD